MQRGRFRSGFDRPPGRQPLDKSKEGERERERGSAKSVRDTPSRVASNRRSEKRIWRPSMNFPSFFLCLGFKVPIGKLFISPSDKSTAVRISWRNCSVKNKTRNQCFGRGFFHLDFSPFPCIIYVFVHSRRKKTTRPEQIRDRQKTHVHSNSSEQINISESMYLWFLQRFDADYFEQLRYKSADLTNLIGGKGAEQRFRDRRVENEWDRTRLDNRLTLRIFELKLTSPRAVEGARTKGANSSGQTFHLSLSLCLSSFSSPFGRIKIAGLNGHLRNSQEEQRTTTNLWSSFRNTSMAVTVN